MEQPKKFIDFIDPNVGDGKVSASEADIIVDENMAYAEWKDSLQDKALAKAISALLLDASVPSCVTMYYPLRDAEGNEITLNGNRLTIDEACGELGINENDYFVFSDIENQSRKLLQRKADQIYEIVSFNQSNSPKVSSNLFNLGSRLGEYEDANLIQSFGLHAKHDLNGEIANSSIGFHTEEALPHIRLASKKAEYKATLEVKNNNILISAFKNNDSTEISIEGHGAKLNGKNIATMSNAAPISGEGGTIGEIRVDNDFLYISLGDTNWKKVALSAM